MRLEESLLQKCLEHLNALPDIKATAEKAPSNTSGGSLDGQLTISGPTKLKVDYTCFIQPDVTGRTAELVIAYLERLKEKCGQRPLLISRHLSNPAIDRLVNQNIEFIDTAGNIYLNSPAAYILIRGKPRPNIKPLYSAKITAKTLQFIYILLKSPSLLKEKHQELAGAAGVTLRTASHALNNLYELGYLQRRRDGSYQITNYIKLLERWEMGYAESLRPKLIVETFTPAGGRKFSDVAESIIQRAKEDSLLIGGELGAAIATGYLHPQSAALYLPSEHSISAIKLRAVGMAVKLKLKPSPQGEIIFLQQFGHQNAWSEYPEPITDPLLLRAELLLTHDERLKETAERLLTQYLAPRQKYA